jgi:hypothetical protein
VLLLVLVLQLLNVQLQFLLLCQLAPVSPHPPAAPGGRQPAAWTGWPHDCACTCLRQGGTQLL